MTNSITNNKNLIEIIGELCFENKEEIPLSLGKESYVYDKNDQRLLQYFAKEMRKKLSKISELRDSFSKEEDTPKKQRILEEIRKGVKTVSVTALMEAQCAVSKVERNILQLQESLFGENINTTKKLPLIALLSWLSLSDKHEKDLRSYHERCKESEKNPYVDVILSALPKLKEIRTQINNFKISWWKSLFISKQEAYLKQYFVEIQKKVQNNQISKDDKDLWQLICDGVPLYRKILEKMGGTASFNAINQQIRLTPTNIARANIAKESTAATASKPAAKNYLLLQDSLTTKQEQPEDILYPLMPSKVTSEISTVPLVKAALPIASVPAISSNSATKSSLALQNTTLKAPEVPVQSIASITRPLASLKVTNAMSLPLPKAAQVAAPLTISSNTVAPIASMALRASKLQAPLNLVASIARALALPNAAPQPSSSIPQILIPASSVSMISPITESMVVNAVEVAPVNLTVEAAPISPAVADDTSLASVNLSFTPLAPELTAQQLPPIFPKVIRPVAPAPVTLPSTTNVAAVVDSAADIAPVINSTDALAISKAVSGQIAILDQAQNLALVPYKAKVCAQTATITKLRPSQAGLSDSFDSSLADTKTETWLKEVMQQQEETQQAKASQMALVPCRTPESLQLQSAKVPQQMLHSHAATLQETQDDNQSDIPASLLMLFRPYSLCLISVNADMDDEAVIVKVQNILSTQINTIAVIKRDDKYYVYGKNEELIELGKWVGFCRNLNFPKIEEQPIIVEEASKPIFETIVSKGGYVVIGHIALSDLSFPEVLNYLTNNSQPRFISTDEIVEMYPQEEQAACRKTLEKEAAKVNKFLDNYIGNFYREAREKLKNKKFVTILGEELAYKLKETEVSILEILARMAMNLIRLQLHTISEQDIYSAINEDLCKLVPITVSIPESDLPVKENLEQLDLPEVLQMGYMNVLSLTSSLVQGDAEESMYINYLGNIKTLLLWLHNKHSQVKETLQSKVEADKTGIDDITAKQAETDSAEDDLGSFGSAEDDLGSFAAENNTAKLEVSNSAEDDLGSFVKQEESGSAEDDLGSFVAENNTAQPKESQSDLKKSGFIKRLGSSFVSSFNFFGSDKPKTEQYQEKSRTVSQRAATKTPLTPTKAR